MKQAAAAAGDSRMGLRLALLSLAVGLAAVNTGNNLLYLILSLALALAMVSLAASRWSLRRLRVTPLLPEEATRGQPFLVGAEVRGRFPLLPQTWVTVRIGGLPEPVQLEVPVAPDAGRGVATVSVTVGRRGVYEGLTVEALTGYPLDLSVRRARQDWRGGLVVLPDFPSLRSVRIGRGRGAGQGGEPSAPSRRAGGAGVELYNIRAYTPHDDARHIDWRSSARTGRLMVREFEREEERRIDLVLDLEAPDEAAFEAAVRRCAGILDFSRRERIDARLLVPGLPSPQRGRDAMRCLAGVSPAIDAAPDAQSPRRPLEEALRLARRDAEVAVISAHPGRGTPIEVD